MKKSVKVIAKVLVVVAIALVLSLAVIGILCEPSDAWNSWAYEWLGWFSGIYLCWKVATILDKNNFFEF